MNTIQIQKAPEAQQSRGSFPHNLVSSSVSVDFSFLTHILWTSGRSWTALQRSGEWGTCEMRSSFFFLFQVSSYYLLAFIYFLPCIPLHQKSWRHACYRHRLASRQVSPVFLREGIVLSELLPNTYLPPAATIWKAQEAWVFPRQAPKTSKFLLCVMKSSPLKPRFPQVYVPPDLVTPLPTCPWLQLSLMPLNLRADPLNLSPLASVSVNSRTKPAWTRLVIALDYLVSPPAVWKT